MDNGRKNRKTKKEINYRSTEIPDSSFLLKRKSKFREVFFAQIPEKPDLLRSELSERWKINPPEAIISITGVHHQFNIKDKLKLKRNLINAVTKTGSWIITCGIESGVVQFIEDAVDEYITLEDLHVPIVGLLSQRVLHEMSVSKEQKKLKRKDFRTRMEERSGSWLEIPVLSTKETLDSNHTQFVFIDDSQEGQARTDAASECRTAFENFLLRICRLNSNPKIQTGDILPVVLVLIEGGRQELETAVSMLKDDNQVVVIDGSGGAANFLAALYREESDESLEQLKEECFEAYPSSLIRYTMDTIVHIVKKKKKEKIDVYSLNNKTTSVDQVIQNALFKIYTDDFEKKRKKSDDHLKIGYIKKQCKLVRKWNRCDLAEKHIFVARNRTELSTLQTGDEQTRTKFLKRMQKILAKIPIERHFKNSKLKDSDREESSYKYFKGRISKLDNEKDGYFTTFIESLDGLEKRLNREFDHVDEKLKKDCLETIKQTATTGDEYTMTTCHKKMQNILGLIPEESSYKYLKRRISKLNDVKAGYFAYLNESLEGLKKRLERDFDHVDKSLETLLRKTEEKIATASDQDSITELFESSLLDNKTDFVKLIMDRLENFNAFVRRYIPILYEKCNRTDTAIHLVVQDRQQNSTIILEKIRDFLRNLFGDSNFQFYEDEKPIAFYEDKRPYYHCFVWAILLNRKEMATIFWEKDTDYICSALFASAVLKELSKRAYFSNNVELTMSLTENSRYFENEACTLMTELYESYPERGFELLVNKVSRYNSTPLAIAASQQLTTFMANSACQAKLNDIWMGKIAPHTPAWRIVMTVLFPVLIIQKIGFITIANYNSSRINPSKNDTATNGMTEKNNTDHPKGKTTTSWTYSIQETLSCVYFFYKASIVKFLFYLITYLAFVVIFSIFVLTDLHPLSESSPSVFEYMTWLWTLSLAIEEIRQIVQTNKGSFTRNIIFWAKDVWNIFDMLMYLLFFVSVMARCLLISDDFYYARMAYAITLAMFIFRTMHFFFVARYLGPKVVMIGRLIGDLAFFFALFALFVFSFGIMYQAVLFPNSMLPPWELFKELIYLPYWQLYGELNLDQIEGNEPTDCTSNPVLYTNGTLPRCAQKNQFNTLILAIYLVLTNIVLVNLLIAMFSRTFEKVEDNSETIWKFNRYALVYEYHDRPMFPIPIIIHLTRIIVLCYHVLRKRQYKSPFEQIFKDEERRKLHIVESLALSQIQGKQDTSNTKTERKDKSANTKPEIDDTYEEI